MELIFRISLMILLIYVNNIIIFDLEKLDLTFIDILIVGYNLTL